MKNIEEIKAKVTELSEKFYSDYSLMKNNLTDISYRLNELEVNQTGDYVFTKEQMYEFVCKLHSGFVESIERNLSANFEADTDCVSLDLYGREIVVDIDNNSIITNVISCIEDEADLDTESVIDTVNNIYKDLLG